MVRKKKTKGSTPPQSNVEPIVASSSPLLAGRSSLSSFSAKSVATVVMPTVVLTADVLCVGLSKSKVSTGTNTKGGGGGGVSLRYLPRVVLSEQDAASLDILPDEDVIVLGRSTDKASLSGALICKALVSKQQSSSSSSLKSPTSYSSPSSSSKKSTSSSSVAVGSIQIQPSDMLNLLLAPKNSDESLLGGFPKRTVISESHVPATPVTPAAAATDAKQQAMIFQTPKSNKSFSFQIGGGGDALYSNTSPSPSSSIRKPQTPLSCSSSISAMYSNDRFSFWILPLESRLGSRVAQQITNNNNNNTSSNNNNGPCCCYRIHLEPLPNKNTMDDQHQQPSNRMMIENDDDSSSSALPATMVVPSKNATSSRILERIILATYIGRFVQAQEIVRVTFQGKLLQLEITHVETTNTNTTTSQADYDDDDDKKKNNTNQVATSDHEKLLITDEFEKKLVLGNDNDDCNNNNKYHESSPSSEDAKQLLQQISCFRTTKQLYKVTYETQISVTVTSSTTSSSNITKSKDDYSSCTVPNHEQQRPAAAAAVAVEHVVGLSSVMKQVRDLLWTPLTRPELFVQKEGTAGTAATAIKAPRGILLHGPSGVGKSSLARQVAAELESSCRCEVQFVNCILLQSQTALVGQAERQLSKYFQRSKQQGRPKLLIFDDIHLICPRRGGGGSTDQLASTLLALLDGIEPSSSSSSSASSLRHNKKAVPNRATSTYPVVILAITSNPSLLDPALRRPGRLDVEVEVPIPDEPSTRAEILRFHVMQKTASGPLTVPALTDDDWLMLAKLAKGFTGADCMLAVKEAVRTALFRKMRLSAQSTSPKSEHASTVELTIHDLASAIRATKPSSIKSITVEIPRVPWTSIGGMDEVKRELREAIELPLTHGDLFQRLGVPPPRGILLYGPPGCSKTLMARALATEGQMNFLSVKGPELLSKWLGESERALASLFRRARMASPSIIFFDEIDAIASARGSGDSAGGGGRLLSQLLTELDGVVYTNSSSAKGSKSNRVVVVCATNRPDLLDRALTRPGRIDRMIYVGVPDIESRRQIFKVTLKDKSRDSDIDLEYLSRDEVSKGFSGAEIVAICQDAALFALEETDDSPEVDHKGTTKVSMRHLLKATKGMQRQITPEMLDFYATYQNNNNTNL